MFIFLQGDSGEASIDNTVLEVSEDDLIAAKKALHEAISRQEALEKERCQLLEELAASKLKQQELLSTMTQKKKMTIKELAKSVFLKKKPLDEMDEDKITVNGGRLALIIDDDSQKSKLINDGPRREIPVWMARRIDSVRPKFPPRKIDFSEVNTSQFKSLELPNPTEVWSIAQAKPKDGDTLTNNVVEKEVIQKKRKALERALQRKTVQWQETPEEIKLGAFFLSSFSCCKPFFPLHYMYNFNSSVYHTEPGTGTGREIVVSNLV